MKKEKKEWWGKIFDSAYLKTYVDQFPAERTTREVLFIHKILKQHSAKKVLDLGCGQGRHSIALANLGYTVTGIDYSARLLDIAKSSTKTLETSPTFLQKDMRTLTYKNRFSAVICLFTAFGYFKNEKDHEKVLRGVYRSIHNKGVFILDLNNIFRLASDIVKIGSTDTHGNITKKTSSQLSNKITLHVEDTFSPSASRWEANVSWKEGGKKKGYTTSVRMFTPIEIQTLLKKVGFSKISFLGNFKGEKYTLNSPRIICIATKD